MEQKQTTFTKTLINDFDEKLIPVLEWFKETEQENVSRAKKIIQRNEDYLQKVGLSDSTDTIVKQANLALTAYQVCCDRIFEPEILNLTHFLCAALDLQKENEHPNTGTYIIESEKVQE